MIVGLSMLVVAIVLIRLPHTNINQKKLFDLLGTLILLGGLALLLEISWWFGLAAIPTTGIIIAIINSYNGIAAGVSVQFKHERLWLITGLSVFTAAAWVIVRLSLDPSVVIQSGLWLILLVTIISNLLLSAHLKRYKLTPAKKLPLDELDKLPTVSLLIPARNESHALNDTITKLLQSNYPKLEVLILDDCSHDQTPEIIRSFAHDGARFVEGVPPSEQWLGRNWALHQLSEAANGEVLIFADVDVKFGPDSVADIVGVMQRDELDMASFTPAQTPADWLGWLLPSLTNFWLSLIPFSLVGGRAAIGRCFAIKSDLINTDGFRSYQSSVYPVYKLSKQLLRSGKRYKFFFGKTINLTIRQHYSSIANSLRRLLAPAISSRIDLAILLVISGVTTILLPLAGVLNEFTLLAFVTYLAVSILFIRVAWRVNGYLEAVIALLWPLHVLHELWQLVVSIIYYRFTDLTWKERQVCMPLLETKKQLPEV